MRIKRLFTLVLKRNLFFALLPILTCSCATIMNRPNTRVAIVTNTPVKVLIGSDTLLSWKNRVVLDVPRRKDPLKLIVFNDTVSRNIVIHSGNSFGYWCNIYGTLGIGTRVERSAAKRYAYPKKVSVSMNTAASDSFAYMPDDSRTSKFRNNLKISPLRFLFSHPGMELSYERYIGKRFSVQAAIAHLYNLSFEYDPGGGTQFNVEGKYFDIPRVKRLIPYVSMEAGYFDIVGSDDGYKTFYYFIPKFGAQCSAGKRFIVDFYIGLGAKRQKNHDIYNSDGSTWEYWQAKIAFNCKIGWRF